MKAKQAKQLSKLLAFLGAILALVAVIMIFLPQIVSANENSDTAYNGIKLAFGATRTSADLGGIVGGSSKITFSFMNLLAYILVLVGLVITVLQLVGMCKGKLATLIAAIALIAGGVLFFFVLNFSSIATTTEVLGHSKTTTATFASYNSENTTIWKLGYGALVGGITAIAGGVLTLGKAVID